MQPKHNRKLVYSGIDLVAASMEHDLAIYEKLQDEFDDFLECSGYLIHAPFLWVGLIFRYGLKQEKAPHYRKIDPNDGELELAKELDMRVLLTADETDPDLLKTFLEIATLDSLIHAGKKYKLKIDELVKRRSTLGKIPEWDPKMDDEPELLIRRYQGTLEP